MEPANFPYTVNRSSINPALLRENKQEIINQDSHFPRASKIGSPEPYHFVIENLFTRKVAQSLFGSWSPDLIKQIFSILFYCNRESILMLRLVSQGFYDLASCVYEGYLLSPSANKAAVFFQHNEFYSTITHQDKKNLISSIQKVVEVCVTISVNNLLKPSDILTLISEDKLKLILKINNLHELNQFQMLLSNQPDLKFINNIKELDFSEFNMDSADDYMNILLTTIYNKRNFIPNLTNLMLKNIRDGFRS